jgi:hypothetical protein
MVVCCKNQQAALTYTFAIQSCRFRRDFSFSKPKTTSMKKNTSFHMRYLVVLMVLCFPVARAQAYIYMTGPWSACTNSMVTFGVSQTDACSYGFSWTAIQNGSVIGSGGGSVFVVYIGSSTASVTVTVNAYPYSGGGGCYSSSDSRNVSVATVSGAPGTPSAVSILHFSGYLYDLSTSSANATSYEWTINSGATIQGSATGATIRILANSNCYFSFSVRGKNYSCGTQYSSSVSGSHTIAPPGAPGYVSGVPYIPKGSSAIFTAYNEPHDPGVFNWSLSDPGGALSLYPSGGASATVYHNGATQYTLYEAYINVWRTSACGTSATVSALTRYGNNAFSMASGDEPMSVYPNPAAGNSTVRVNASGITDLSPEKVRIFDWSGKAVTTYKVTKDISGGLEIEGLPRGLYTIQLVNGNKEVTSQRLTVR